MVTESEVRKCVKFWKKRLQLQDWTINVKIAEVSKALDDVDVRACCEAFPEYKKALIEFDDTRIEPENLDGYVIHELLHCHITGFANISDKLSGGLSDDKKVVITYHEEALASAMERLVLSLTEERTCQRKSTEKQPFCLRPTA